MTYWQSTEIKKRWRKGENTFEISQALGFREAAVERFIFDQILKRKWAA